MTEDGDKSHQQILGKQMLAGGTAGMLADMVMYPMMTVKSRLMVRNQNQTKSPYLSFLALLLIHQMACVITCSNCVVLQLWDECIILVALPSQLDSIHTCLLLWATILSLGCSLCLLLHPRQSKAIQQCVQ